LLESFLEIFLFFSELAEEVIERNKLKPLSKDSLKKKSFNNCVGNGGGIYFCLKNLKNNFFVGN